METTCYIETPLGITEISGCELGILKISIVENGIVSEIISENLQVVVTQLQEYFLGTRTNFDFKIHFSGTDFQKMVWTELLKIPFGKTISYLALAKKLGNPKVIRAAASANGKNPLWIVVPCHRVIGTDGSLTGYAGGLWRKKWLLEHENPTQQQILF